MFRDGGSSITAQRCSKEEDMTKAQVILKVREKLIKLQFYHHQATETFGQEIAKEMFHNDLDYLASLLVLLGTANE